MWHEIGLGDLSRKLVEYVPVATSKNRSDYYRRTEFWEFADLLDDKGQQSLAQRVRSQISVLSLGIVATNLNLHGVYPAAQAANIDRVFGTQHPWHESGSETLLPETTRVDVELTMVQRDLRYLAGFLSPEDVWEIRESKEYGAYLAALSAADGLEHAQAGATLVTSMKRYYTYLEVWAAARLQERTAEWSKIRAASRRISLTKATVPTAVGILSNIATAATSMKPGLDLMASIVPTALTSACSFLVG